MKKLLFLFLLFLSAQLEAQTNLYVDGSQLVSGNGQSWANAYQTLNEALNYVNAASTTTSYIINVAKGTYYPTGLQSGTNRDSTFAIVRGGVTISGGYPTGGGARDITVNPTIFSGNIGSATDSGDNSYHVMVLANILVTNDSTIVDGVTIENGWGNLKTNSSHIINGVTINRQNGGGISMQSVGNKVGVRNCTIINNASYYGGGIYNSNSSPFIYNCIISQNISLAGTYGGGMYNDGSSTPYILSDTFSDNRGAEGGAIYSTSPSSVYISVCAFSNNIAISGGGAIYNSSATAIMYISGCTFSNNMANSNNGGAIYLTSFADVSTCTFSNNLAARGGAIYSNQSNNNGSTVNLNISNSTFTQNKATSASLVKGAGGAICIEQTGYVLNITNSTFTGNTALNSWGGAIYSAIGFYSNVSFYPVIDHCTFTNDTASLGGAIYNSGFLALKSCHILTNWASEGGGLYSTSFLKINGSNFAGNKANLDGGACFLRYFDTVANTLFAGNYAANRGGALCIQQSGTNGSLTNVTFSGDSAVNGNAIYDTVASPNLVNCIVWDGVNSIFNFSNSNPTVTYSLVQGGYSGVGNLNTDPLFVNPIPASSAPTTLGDYTTYLCSPAVNAGINILQSYTGVSDLAGNHRLFGKKIDLGAYERQDSSLSIGVITGANGVCEHGSFQLNDTSAGGIWISNNTLIATINNNGMVNAVLAGTDTITYTVTDATHCAEKVIKSISINPNPIVPPITGADSVCINSSIQMGNTVNGGAWASNNSSVARITGGINVTGVLADTTHIFYTVTNSSGCRTTVNKLITVKPLPSVAVITGDSNVCVNNSIQLADSTIGGTWASTKPTLAEVNTTGLVNGKATGTASIWYTIVGANGCSNTAVKTVNVNKIDTAITQNEPMLKANQNGASYQWVNCSTNSPVPGADSQSFTPTINGDYAVVISYKGCVDTSTCITISNVGVSNINAENKAIQIYPNPSTGTLSVVTSNGLPDYIDVLDMAGKLLQKVTPSSNTTVLNLSNYDKGVYLIELHKGGEKHTEKVSLY